MRYILLILLLIPLVYAQDSLILSKDNYQQNEMFQAEVFMENIKPQDISVLNPYGFPSTIGVNLLKLTKAHYFIFFEIPKVNQGVYTLKIKEEKKQFQITSQKEKLSISTGAVKYTQESSPFFKITISNQDIRAQTIDITSSTNQLTPSLNQIIIPAKSSKTFNIKLQKPGSNLLSVLSVNNYNIPVWYIIDEEVIAFFEKEVKQIQRAEKGLVFYTKSDTQLNYITKEIQESTPIVDSIYFKNHLNETLTNLKLSLTDNLQNIVKLGFTELDSLEPEQKKKLDITVNENRLLYEKEYSGNLLITTDKHNFKLSINFIVVEKAEEPEALTIEETTEPIKEEIILEEPEEKPSRAKYIYLIVLIIILIILAYIFIKKPKKKKQTFKEFIKKAGY